MPRGAARRIYGFGNNQLKVYPEHLVGGLLGLPVVGDIYYVDPSNGSDTANNGRSHDKAYATVSKALSSATADQDDVIIIADTGSSSGRTSETSAITWSKRRTHLLGNGAPRRINPRNGIGFGAGLSPGLTVSANNCIFANVSIATFVDNNILVDVTSNYNTFMNVHFQGIGNATAGDDTAARSLRLNGAEENEFINCTIGLDTVTRSAANANLELTGSCPRNKFINCDFPAFTDNAGVLWLKADTGNAYERFLTFENCHFFNPDNASSTTMTIGFDLSTTGNGDIALSGDSFWRGATDLANNYDNLYSAIPVFDGANAGVLTSIAT